MDKDIVKIIVEYDNGSTENIDKGVLSIIEEGEETIAMNMKCIKMSGQDMHTFFDLVFQMAVKIGYFDEDKD